MRRADAIYTGQSPPAIPTRQHKWQRAKETFTPAGARAVIATGKSVSGGLAMLGSVVAGVQVLIAAGVLIFH